MKWFLISFGNVRLQAQPDSGKQSHQGGAQEGTASPRNKWKVWLSERQPYASQLHGLHTACNTRWSCRLSQSHKKFTVKRCRRRLALVGESCRSEGESPLLVQALQTPTLKNKSKQEDAPSQACLGGPHASASRAAGTKWDVILNQSASLTPARSRGPHTRPRPQSLPIKPGARATDRPVPCSW